MKRLFLSIFFLFFLWSARVCANASTPRFSGKTWTEVKSPHFTVITDGAVKQGRSVARHFEQIREVFRTLSPKLRVDPSDPVVILAVRNENDLRVLLPAYWATRGHMHPAGVFLAGPERNYVAVRMDVNSEMGYHVVYHEYVHLLESLNFSSIPLWLSEGLADFYGAAHIEKGDVGLGYPIRGDLAVLNSGEWLPLAKLVTADSSSPYYTKGDLSSIFYAESWELTHYLFTSDNGQRAQELILYDNLIDQGMGSLQAAEQAFGNLDKLEGELASYARKPVLNYLRVKTTVSEDEQKFPAQTMTVPQRDAVLGDFYVYTDRPVEARAALENAIHGYPKLASPYVSLGLLSLEQNHQKAALKWLNQAVALDARSYLAYYYRAALLMSQGGPAEAKQAESDLNHSLELNANFAQGYDLLAQLYAMDGSRLNVALGVALRAVELEPGSVQHHLTAGYVFERLGEMKRAEAQAKAAIMLARGTEDRQRAEKFLATLQFRLPSGSSGVTFAGAAPAETPGAKPAGPPESRTVTGKNAFSSKTFLIATGVARQVGCEGGGIHFLLMVNGSGVPLSAPDLAFVKFSVPASLAGHFSPCTMLDGKRVTVKFRVVHPNPMMGTPVEVDLSSGP